MLKLLTGSAVQVYNFDSTRSIAPKLENEALWLGTMNTLVGDMRNTVAHLKETVAELEENSKFNKSSMREAIQGLLSQANRATEMIQVYRIQPISDKPPVKNDHSLFVPFLSD